MMPPQRSPAHVDGLLAWRRGYASRRDGVASIGLGALTLPYLLMKFGGQPPEGVTRDIRYGLWGVVAANVAIVLGGFLSYFAPTSRASDTTTWPDDAARSDTAKV